MLSRIGFRTANSVSRRLKSSMAVAAEQVNTHKESATYKFRQERLVAIAARKQDAVKAKMVSTESATAPVAMEMGKGKKVAAGVPKVEVKVPAAVHKKTGKPLYMIQKPVSSADAFRAHRQKVKAGVAEDFESPKYEEKAEDKQHNASEGAAVAEGTTASFGKTLIMMLATGVAVEAAVFYAKEGKENPPGKLVQLYRYVWEKRFTDAMRVLTK